MSARPLTAFSRLVDHRTAEHFTDPNVRFGLGAFSNASLGLVMAEAATYAFPSRELKALSPSACLSTLSYAIARAAALRVPAELLFEIPERWKRIRLLLGASAPPPQVGAVLRVWSVFAQLAQQQLFFESMVPVFPVWESPSRLVMRACEELYSTGELGAVWSDLSMAVPSLTRVREELTGPREGRVAILEQVLDSVRVLTPQDRDAVEFALAYIASSISPGTLDHLSLLAPLIGQFPGVLLWYGLMAGFSKRQAVSSSVNGLGRRVARELARVGAFLDSPTCDIAYEELDVLGSSARDLKDMRLGKSNAVVEIVPCVNGSFRVRGEEGSNVVDATLLGEALEDFELRMEQMNRSLRNLRRIAGVAESGFPPGERTTKRRSTRNQL